MIREERGVPHVGGVADAVCDPKRDVWDPLENFRDSLAFPFDVREKVHREAYLSEDCGRT